MRHHLGSGRRAVIPDDWSAHHRGVVSATHTAAVEVRHNADDGGTFDRGTGTYTGGTAATPYYADTARIQVLGDTAQVALAAEQQVSTLRYAVSLDHAVTGIELGDIVKVTAVGGNGDVSLVDRELTVEAITRGSLHWERRLICTDDLETPATP